MASKTCSSPLLRARITPKGSSQTVPVGVPVQLAAMQLDCALPKGPVSVSISYPDGSVLPVDLSDDGNVVLDDGIYEAPWTPPYEGDFKVTFFVGGGPGVADKFTVTAQ